MKTKRIQNDPAAMAAELVKHLASRSRPLKLGEIMEEVPLDGMVNRSTYYRWLVKAREMGLAEMTGDSRHDCVWTATEEPRLQVLKEHLAAPLEKRPVVTYDEAFIEFYEPNHSSYLTKGQIKRLHNQCAPGSAAFAALNAHDQSLFMCGLSYASSRLEGNVYDMAATEKLLASGLEKEGASPTETTMVLNHHEAVRYLVDNIHFPRLKNDVSVSARDIKSLHALLSAYLLKDPMMCGGIRAGAVRIKDSSYIPLSIPDAIERAFHLTLEKAQAIKDPFEQAMFLLVHIPYLQPFEDCNKRTARVACNIPLLQKGVVPMSWLDVEHDAYIEATLGVYERNNTSLLAEVFVDGYIHASERFNVMQRSCEPNETLVRYRQEVRTTIRSVVLEGDVDIPEEVAEEDREEFRILVEEELAQLRSMNPGSLVRFKLEEADIRAWIRRRGSDFLDAAPVVHRYRQKG